MRKFLLCVAVLLVTGSAYAADRVAMPSTPVASGIQAAQQAVWRGLQIPDYPGATGVTVSKDDDEYELSFQSSDSLERVFAYYRDLLVRQGFQVRNTETDDRDERKADLRRGQGGSDDSIELEVELRNGRYRVEIEFDD